jgi:hypothetical protein
LIFLKLWYLLIVHIHSLLLLFTSIAHFFVHFCCSLLLFFFATCFSYLLLLFI